MQIPAYVVLAGGGMKVCALAGCLKAAEEWGVEFRGFGGTSGGALLAALACSGYSGNELERIITKEFKFEKLLHDGGKDLLKLKRVADSMENPVSAARQIWKHRRPLATIHKEFGLYEPRYLTDFLREKIL